MSTIVNPTTDNAKVPTSEAIGTHLTIVNRMQDGDGMNTWLTAYEREEGMWHISVDCFSYGGTWDVYAVVSDDHPLTTDALTAMLAAHEDAKGIADHLNSICA